MEGLKRVDWMMGQPLLPSHLEALEEAVLTHAFKYQQTLGLPGYGIQHLKWDDSLLSQGVVSISQCALIFPKGFLVDVTDNGTVDNFDLNKAGKRRVTLYLHLLKDITQKEEHFKSTDEDITYSIQRLSLSTTSTVPNVLDSLKLGVFEKNLDNHWDLSSDYIPPITETFSSPFLRSYLSHIKTFLNNFQEKIGPELTSGTPFQGYTIKTKLCLGAVAELRRTLMNSERGVLSHPFFVYERLCKFIDTVSLVYNDRPDLQIIAYDHNQISPLFALITKTMEALLQFETEAVECLQFEKKNNHLVIEKLPAALADIEDIYLVIQPLNTTRSVSIEGVKLAGLSRLSNIIRFALPGIPIVRLEHAPFNNNFSKDASVYAIKKDAEWEFAVKEGKLAFAHQSHHLEAQGSLYWRN